VHVLTKIFIVLVSLLAVLLVPLVVVYAHNENSYQARFQEAEAGKAAADSDLAAAKAAFGAAQAQKERQINELSTANRNLRKQIVAGETDVRELEGRLIEAESGSAEINAKLATLVSAVDAGQRLTESLIDELRQLRKQALDSERRLVDIEQAYDDTQAQLEVAIEARRALQEELQRLKDEHGVALETIAGYVALYGTLDRAVETVGVPPTKDLSATIINVRRSSDQILAEIDAGSRDGVEIGWLMTIGHGGEFVARLRVISVDINRATGIVELEQRPVEVGQLVYARTTR